MYTGQVYFAFPDSVYHYVCAECTAICCRGGGFGGSLKNEIRQLYVLYPNVENLVAARQGDYVGFFNPSDACVFLEGDNRCRVEREHGKAAKPTNRSPTRTGRLRRRVGGAAREAALTLRA